jgi:hypothetical protein
VARRLAERNPLVLTEDVPATAALRPVHDDLINRPRRKQRPTVALMAVLSAPLATRRVLAARRRRRRIRTRRTRGVTRTLLQLALKLLDPCLQLLDTPIHPQQHLDHDLPTSVIDRLRLSALHAPIFDAAQSNPPHPLNAYQNISISRDFS